MKIKESNKKTSSRNNKINLVENYGEKEMKKKKITKTFGIIEINMLPIKKRNYKMHKKKHRYF